MGRRFQSGLEMRDGQGILRFVLLRLAAHKGWTLHDVMAGGGRSELAFGFEHPTDATLWLIAHGHIACPTCEGPCQYGGQHVSQPDHAPESWARPEGFDGPCPGCGSTTCRGFYKPDSDHLLPF